MLTEKKVILVVDDEASFREIFKFKLESCGYKVETAQNGEEGIERAKVLKPALVLLDVQMPVLNGIDAFIKMKEMPELAGQKVAFLTNMGSWDPMSQSVDSKFAKELGAMEYLSKVEDLANLVDKVTKLVGE